MPIQATSDATKVEMGLKYFIKLQWLRRTLCHGVQLNSN